MLDYAAKWAGRAKDDKFHELDGVYPLRSCEYFSYSPSICPLILSHLRSAIRSGKTPPVRIFMVLHP